MDLPVVKLLSFPLSSLDVSSSSETFFSPAVYVLISDILGLFVAYKKKGTKLCFSLCTVKSCCGAFCTFSTRGGCSHSIQRGSDSLFCVFRPPLNKSKAALPHLPFFSCIQCLSFCLNRGRSSAVCLCLHFHNLCVFTSCLEVYMYTAAAEVGVYLDCCSLPAGCKSTPSTRTHAIFSSSFASRVSHCHRSDFSRRQRAGS